MPTLFETLPRRHVRRDVAVVGACLALVIAFVLHVATLPSPAAAAARLTAIRPPPASSAPWAAAEFGVNACVCR
jgi:hypothetical protein